MALAVVAAVALVVVPALRSHLRRAASAEVLDALEQVFKGAVFYYAAPQTRPDGSLIPCQFPASEGVTPVEATCCGSRGGPDRDGDGRCDEAPEPWSTPTWRALRFRPEGDYRYVYAFRSVGTMTSARFVASAYGDLDCDGVSSTFRRVGRGYEHTRPLECKAVGSPAIDEVHDPDE